MSESLKCRFSKCRFSVLNLKFDFISGGGCTREKQIQKALGSLPPCGNRCRFSESAICSSRVHPPSEIKSNFKFETLRWRPLRWRLIGSPKRRERKVQRKKWCRTVFRNNPPKCCKHRKFLQTVSQNAPFCKTVLKCFFLFICVFYLWPEGRNPRVGTPSEGIRENRAS